MSIYLIIQKISRVGRDETIFIFFQNGNKNCRVGIKNIRVGRASGSTAIFFGLIFPKCGYLTIRMNTPMIRETDNTKFDIHTKHKTNKTKVHVAMIFFLGISAICDNFSYPSFKHFDIDVF